MAFKPVRKVSSFKPVRKVKQAKGSSLSRALRPVKKVLKKEEKAVTNLLSIPLYAVSPELRDYVARFKRGEVPAPESIEELKKLAFFSSKGGSTTRQLIQKTIGATALDVASIYRPSTLIALKGVGKLAGMAIKGGAPHLTRFAAKRAPGAIKVPYDALKRFMTVGRGAPPQYTDISRLAKLERAAGGREAEAVSKVLTTEPFSVRQLSIKEQRIVGRIFRKEAENIRNLPKYQKYSAIAKEGRSIMDKWSKELAQSGIPSKEATAVIDDNIEKYMARMFPKYLAKNAPRKALRLQLNGLKHRKDLSSEVLRQMKVIKEPALPTAIRVKEISTTAANAKLFKTVAANPEWASATNTTGRMVKMGSDKALGALKDKYVIPSIAADVNGILNANTQAQSLYMKSLSAWKFGKVVLNPSTHVRNIMSNSMLLDLSGVSHARQAMLMPRVMKDYLSRGRTYQLALKHGAIGGEFVGAEIAKVQQTYLQSQGGHLRRMLNIAKKPFRKAANIYQGEEQLAKMVKFTDGLSKGLTPELAAKEAQKWLFDYSEIPRFMELAKHGAPFATFTYKAIPRIAEAMVKNPLKVYKYYKLFRGWNQAAAAVQGMSPDEFARKKKLLPPWLMRDIGGMPTNLLMPWKDEHGRTQWLNLEYILPIGMAPEILQKGLIKGGIGNPFFNILSDLNHNQDFKGSPIIPGDSTKAEATKAVTNYIYRQLAPSFAPGLEGIKGWGGGYSFSKLMNSIKKVPDFADRVRNVPTVLMDVLAGIKITPLDVGEAQQFKMENKKKRINNLRAQVRRLQHPAISEEERDKQVEQLFIKIQKIVEE